MDRRIILRAPATAAVDALNAGVISYPTDTAAVWARRIYKRGAETYANAQIDAQRLAAFRIRYRSDVDETWQVESDGVTYNILAVLELGRQEGLDIEAQAHVPQE